MVYRSIRASATIRTLLTVITLPNNIAPVCGDAATLPPQTPPHISFHHLFSIDFSSIHRALVICHNGSTVWLSLLGNPCTFLWYATVTRYPEQPVGGGILAYCFRSLLQVVCTGFLIGGGERLDIQFLGLLAVVVEVVVRRGPLVEVVAFGVVHQREFIVAVGMHVLQPCGEFHVVDVEINADFGELATQLIAEFRAVRVGVGEG